MLQIAVANVRAVDDEDDGMAAGVIALPQLAQGVLAAHVPQLDVHVWQGYGRDVLADSGDRLELRLGRIGEVHGFDLFVEGRLAGIVEAEEDDGVFYMRKDAALDGGRIGYGVRHCRSEAR